VVFVVGGGGVGLWGVIWGRENERRSRNERGELGGEVWFALERERKGWERRRGKEKPQ